MSVHVADQLLVLDHHFRRGFGGRAVAERQREFEYAKLFNRVVDCGEPVEDFVGAIPRANELPTPAGEGRILGLAVKQPADGGRIAHLERRAGDGLKADILREKLPERAVAGDVGGDKGVVAAIAALVAAGEPSPVGFVGLDYPEAAVARRDIVVGVHAPFQVRSADEINAQLGQDVGRVVERLSEILDAAPHKHVKRSGVIPAGALDDPLRALGRATHAGVRGHLGLALLGDCAQRVGRRIAVRIRSQVGIIALVAVDDREDVLLAALAEGRGDHAFEVKAVRINQEVDHRLEVVEVGPADVGGDNDTVAR